MGEKFKAMFLKRLATGLALSLVVSTMLPFSASALTVDEITQAEGTVLGATVYPMVLITSTTNTSMKITAQAQAFNGSQWLYQLCWSRTRNAVGSVYVAPKLDVSTKTLTNDNASQIGCGTFMATPGTSNRIEFYSKPAGQGILLVRKYLVVRAADPNAITYIQPTGYSSSTGYYQYSGSTQPASYYTPGWDPTVNPGVMGYSDAAAASNPHTTDFLATLVYSNGSGKCFFYNYTGTSPIITPLASCPSPTPVSLPNGPANLSPYDSSLYGQNCTAMHVHMPGTSAGGASIKVISPIVCGTANGVPQANSQYTPGYNNYGQGYTDAESAANPHTSDFLATLVYSNGSGRCFFYNFSGASPITTPLASCPSPMPVSLPNGPANLSPYDSSLYGQNCTAMHVHMANANGGSSTKVISPIICGTANGVPQVTSPYTPGYNNYGQGYTDAESASNPHTSDFLATLVYSDGAGKCFFYNYTGASPITTPLASCPSPMPLSLPNGPANLSPYDSSLYGQTATCMHVHLASANGGSSTKVISPIFCGTANGVPSQYSNPSTPGYDPTANNTNYYAAQLAEHNSDFIETLVYKDSSGACHFYKDFGSPVVTNIACPNYVVPTVSGSPSQLSPYDSSIYNATCTAQHVHLPGADGGAADKQLSPIICGTANGVPSQYGQQPNQNGQPLTSAGGSPASCYSSSTCGSGKVCFGATPSTPGTCQ